MVLCSIQYAHLLYIILWRQQTGSLTITATLIMLFIHLVVLYLPLCNTFQLIVIWEPQSLSWLVVSFRNSWRDLDLCDNENVWGEEVQYKFWYDTCCGWWTICGALETYRDKWRLPVDFCSLDCQGNQPQHCSFCHLWQWEWMLDIMLDQLWPLYLPSGNVDEYLNHALWLSL